MLPPQALRAVARFADVGSRAVSLAGRLARVSEYLRKQSGGGGAHLVGAEHRAHYARKHVDGEGRVGGVGVLLRGLASALAAGDELGHPVL